MGTTTSVHSFSTQSLQRMKLIDFSRGDRTVALALARGLPPESVTRERQFVIVVAHTHFLTGLDRNPELQNDAHIKYGSQRVVALFPGLAEETRRGCN